MKKYVLNWTLLFFLVLFVQNSFAQDISQLSLPEGAKARLGKGYIEDIEYSPDGRHLAVASSVGIWIYDTATGQVLDLLTGHENRINDVAFSLDGDTIATVSDDSTFRLWDVQTGENKRTITTTGAFSCIAFSPDGNTIATGGFPETVVLWDAPGEHKQTLSSVHKGLVRGHNMGVLSIAFSPDGNTIATGGADRQIRLWDAHTGKDKGILLGHGKPVLSLTFSPDGRTLASGSWISQGDSSLGTIYLWDIHTGQRKRELSDTNLTSVSSLAFSRNGRTIMAPSREGSIVTWDVNTGVVKGRVSADPLEVVRSHGRIGAVAFSPDGNTVAGEIGFFDRTIQFWDARTGKNKGVVISGHTHAGIYEVSFSPDGRTLATQDDSQYSKLVLWDVHTGQRKQTLLEFASGFRSVMFSPRENAIVGAYDKAIALFNVDTGQRKQIIQSEDDPAILLDKISVSPDGNTIAVLYAWNGTIYLIDTHTGQLKQTLHIRDDHLIHGISFSPDGRTLAHSSTKSGNIYLWDVHTGQLEQTLRGHRRSVRSVSFSPDGRTLASGSFQEIGLWDVNTGKQKQEISGNWGWVHSVSFSPDGLTLVSGHESASRYKSTDIRLWDVHTGQLKQTLPGHTRRVNSVVFSPDGRTLASGSLDGTVLLWELGLFTKKSTMLVEPSPTVGLIIPDANLAAAVRKALDLGPNAAISKQKLQGLTRLDARDSQIKNLTGLGHATQLELLELRDNQISDIRPLVNVKSLKRLTLENNRVNDIRPLMNMKQLTWLLIGNNPISDFTPFTHLTELRGLSLGGNNMDDVTLLADLTKLTNLWLGHNKISNISPLSDMVNLKVLSLKDNQIRDVSPLVGLVNLETLELRDNPIQDTSPLANLPKLREVDIEISLPTVIVQVEASERPPMYWINIRGGTLHRLVGDEVENLVPTVRNATGLAMDVAGGKLYWIEKTGERTGRIRRANLDGTNVKLVKELTSVPHGIAFDAADGKIYLTNSWGKVQRLNVDGSNFQPNLITELDTPRGLTLDLSGSKVYWIEGAGRIRRANLDGSNIEDIPAGPGTPMNIAVSDSTFYWTVKTAEERGEIRFANLSGNPNVRTFTEFNQGFPIGISVDPVAEKLYWTTSQGNIGRDNIDESSFQPDVVTGLGAPGAFVVYVETKVDVETEIETKEIPGTDAVVSVSPSPVDSPAIGGRLTLNLSIMGGEAVTGYQVTLQFDPTALRYVESSNGDYLPTGAFFVQPVVNRDRVELAATALSGVSDGDGTLAVVTFEVLTVKPSMLTLSDPLLSDSQGNTFRPRVAGGEITEPSKLQTDVNSDGVVNIQDLVLVASNFGKTGQNSADVNDDGVVNITDLVLVAGALGTSAAAPSLHLLSLEMFTTADVQEWLSQAQGLNSNHVDYQRGVLVLEHL